jgi:hypothetical protein
MERMRKYDQKQQNWYSTKTGVQESKYTLLVENVEGKWRNKNFYQDYFFSLLH